MKTLGFYLAVFFTVFVVGTVQAGGRQIQMLNKDDQGNKMVYSEELVYVDVNESITWVPTDKGHNVEIIAAPEGFDIPKKSKNSKEVTIEFTVPGIYYYWCTPHKSMGMIGLVVVGDDTSNKDDIAKAKAMGKSKKKLKKLLGDI